MAYALPCAAQFTYVSPGIGYSGQFFDEEWDHGVATEVSGGIPGFGAFVQFDFYGDGRWRVGVGPQVSYVLGLELGASIRFEDDDSILGLHVSPLLSAGVAHFGVRFLYESERATSYGIVAMAKGPIFVSGDLITGD